MKHMARSAVSQNARYALTRQVVLSACVKGSEGDLDLGSQRLKWESVGQNAVNRLPHKKIEAMPEAA